MKLRNGKFKTKAGSLVTITGRYGGIAEVDFDWFEEDACIDCEPDPYPEWPGEAWILRWHCDFCGGGKAELFRT